MPLVAALILLFALGTLIVSVSYGEYDIPPLEVVRTILNVNQDNPDYANLRLVVDSFRLPRIVLAFLVGAALAASGAIMQGITRNPLADPYLLGVSGGAGLVAVSLIVWFKTVPISLLPFAAFAGALIAAGAIYLFAWKKGSTTPIRLILIGIAVQSLVGAVTTVMLVFGNITDVQQAYVWLTGSVYGRKWDHVYALGAWLLVCLPLALISARSLNLLNLGDDTAKGLGLRVERSARFAADPQRGAGSRGGRRLRDDWFRRLGRAAHRPPVGRTVARGAAPDQRHAGWRVGDARRLDRARGDRAERTAGRHRHRHDRRAVFCVPVVSQPEWLDDPRRGVIYYAPTMTFLLERLYHDRTPRQSANARL